MDKTQTITIIRNRVRCGLGKSVRVSQVDSDVIVGSPIEVSGQLINIFGEKRVEVITKQEVPGPVHSNFNYKVLQAEGLKA